ncbi:hypothetical protein LZP73_01075 [Shewanella sp. AS16]|uniref:TrkH family potassium uptake protein n=1 Tax=Shewanella sp. AS16 TaxID=2907625 RepID=UPI001F2D43AB|nr:potassium transporter TrkG [Shewanella sp. AS16]MCE9684806.1 hypothetical protein [Shewanella sp. AS16]
MSDKEGFKSLLYAARFTVLARMGGRLALLLAWLCLPPLLVALWFAEYAYLPTFAAVILLLLLLAWLSRRLPDPRQFMRSEGFVLTSAAFVLTPLLMTLALWPSGLEWQDLILETVSAVTTTGLSTLQSVAEADRTFLFTRAWMQWYGGLGIVVLSVVFLMPRTVAAYQLLEVPEGQDMVLTVKVYARRILHIYLLLTLVAILVCWLCFGDLFNGLLHGLSAISTGGFSSRDDSLAGLAFSGQLGVMLMGMSGAVSLAIYLRIQQRAWHAIGQNQELRLFLWLTLLVCAVLVWLELAGPSSGQPGDWRHGVILGLSALSTTGFSNTEVASLGEAGKLVLIFAMFLGGCLGSTAGGCKMFRLLLLWRLLLTSLRRTCAAPHAVIEPRLQGKVLNQEQLQQAMLSIGLLAVLCLPSWLAFLCYGYEPLDALFEVVSAVGTVGLSTGITASQLPWLLKAVLCVDMIAGRLEVLALLCLFYPGVWLGRRYALD